VPDLFGMWQALGAYAFGKINPFWTLVKQSFSGKDWDDISLKVKYEAADNMPPTWWQYGLQLLAAGTEPIILQQLGWLGLKGECKGGTNISTLEQVTGARAVNTAISNPKKCLEEQKYHHDLELQKEAQRQHKAALNLETPDYQAAQIAQDAFNRATDELKAERAELGYARAGGEGGGPGGGEERVPSGYGRGATQRELPEARSTDDPGRGAIGAPTGGRSTAGPGSFSSPIVASVSASGGSGGSGNAGSESTDGPGSGANNRSTAQKRARRRQDCSWRSARTTARGRRRVRVAKHTGRTSPCCNFL
jgi:hypothetical protein